MAFFTIRPRQIPGSEKEDLEATIKYLDLTKITEDLFQLASGRRLQLHHDQNGYALEPPQE